MKSKSLLILFFFIVNLGYSQAGPTCQLIVKVENIKRIKGKMKLAIYDHQEKFLETAVTWGDKEILENSITYTFSNLKRGTYAVSIFQDENENGRLDANFIGIPTEPYAFSNNAKGMFGPPSFEDCKFEIVRGDQVIVISL